MPEKINWSLNVQVPGGPTIAFSRSLTVEAYDKIDVTIPAFTPAAPGPPATPDTPGKATVSVQPSGTGKVQFLLITSSVYDDRLTYKVDGGTAVELDAPQLLTGDGIVGLLGNTQKEFVFENAIVDPDPKDATKKITTPASVAILVGRDAKT